MTASLPFVRHRALKIRQFPGTAPARDIYLLHRKRPTALVTDIITVLTQLHPHQAPPESSARPEG